MTVNTVRWYRYPKGDNHERSVADAAPLHARPVQALLGEPEAALHVPGPAPLDGQAARPDRARAKAPLDLTGIDWVIAGGESGPHHRPLDGDWVRELRDACVATERWPIRPAFFFKQWGGRTPDAGGKTLDGREWQEFPA